MKSKRLKVHRENTEEVKYRGEIMKVSCVDVGEFHMYTVDMKKTEHGFIFSPSYYQPRLILL